MIASAIELINSLPISSRAETSIIDNLIDETEENIFRKCFSLDLYKAMYADLVSLVGANYWAANQPFIVNEYCIYQGLKYLNVSGSTSTGDNPTVKQTVWRLQNKFNEQKYNDLWNLYLKKYIAYNVAIPASHFSTVKFEAGGLMINKDTEVNQTSASTKEIYEFKNQLIEQSKVLYENMKAWLIENNNYGNIAIIQECKNDGCTGNKRVSRFSLTKTKSAYS